MLNSGPLASAPTVAVHPDGHEDVFWEGTNGRLYEMQPTSIAASEQGEAGKLGSPPAAAVDPLTGQDHVFWKGSNGYLYELVGTENHWQVKVLSGSGLLGSAPAVAIHPDGEEDVFWKGTNRFLYEMQWYSGKWHTPGRLTGAGKLGSPPTVAAGACAMSDPTGC